MRPHTSLQTSLSLLALTSLLPLSSWAFDCNDIVAQGVHFKLGKLGGPHMVHWLEEDLGHDARYNYTFTVDICNRLKSECHPGTRVCGIRERTDLLTDNKTITPIDIAGTYTTQNSRKIDAQFNLLRNSNSNSDAGREGLRAELHGGRHPFDNKKEGIDQQAIIEFVCDKERSGLEGDEKDKDGDKDEDDKDGDEDGKKEERGLRRDEGKGKCEDSEASLRFCGYQKEDNGKGKEVGTLRLEWRTKYACEDAPADDGGSHWGFFTWFIIILFLATAAYLIFGSWLNYNRYGARGWDLLPHGDTIRDIPYILQDFGRKVAHTIQGPGSRGGYSAV